MSRRSLALGAWLLVAAACAGKRLPPGTPPPEYESRTFAPWPPVSASAAAAPAPATLPSVEGPPVATEAQDAGPEAPRPSPDAGSE